MRFVAVAGASLVSIYALAATITVSDPVNGDFLGRSNNLSFNATGATTKLEVSVTATANANSSISVTQKREFTPNASGQASGTVPLNFPETQLNGDYTITVTVISTDPYNQVPDIAVVVDVKNPKILNFNPIQNTYVNGLVPITAFFDEENIDEWRVTVGGNDIPSNVGNAQTLQVDWDSDAFTNDGPQTIALRIEDKAGNSASQNIPVTIDRLKPSSLILAPLQSQTYRPGARIPVVVEIRDQFSDSLDERTVDVTIEDGNGTFLTRVARISTSRQGNNLIWTGRLRDTSELPSEFVIKVVARDKAGNLGTDQTVTVITTRSRDGGVTVTGYEDDDSSNAVKDAATLAHRRGGMSEKTRGLFTRSVPKVFGRGYNNGRGN